MMTDPKQLEAAAGAAGAELGEAVVSDPDQLLMMRARDGDLDAFHQLFKKYQTPIFNYCIRMIDNYDRAQELTQDAFLQLYRARERYEPTARFITYLFRIATNLCLNERRRRVRWARTMASEMPDENLMPDPRGVPADDVVIHAEALDRVQQAIARLPSRKAAALLLARVDGLSHAEVSETLGISVNAVKSLISRATRTLRTDLGLAGADDPLPQAVAAREVGRGVAAAHA